MQFINVTAIDVVYVAAVAVVNITIVAVVTAKTQSGWTLGFHFCQKIVLMVDMF